ncbi:MAG: hypothetical protein M3463_10305, partial [Verrucomicrobiota bacterium]|nr:hypothetical protein [Verrucomicrobiota bacterium]
FANGGEVGGKIFVAGGQASASSAASTQSAYLLDFSGGPSPDLRWKRLPLFPGAARSLAISFGISEGPRPGFYVFGGRDQKPNALPELFRDGYRYDPALDSWSKLEDLPLPLMAGSAATLVEGKAVVLGGDTGEVFMQKEELAAEIRKARQAIEKSDGAKEKERLRALLAEEKNLLESHKGFSQAIFLYDSGEDSWTRAGEMPAWPPVTTTAVWWHGALVVPSGEIRPGVRSPAVWRAQFRDR